MAAIFVVRSARFLQARVFNVGVRRMTDVAKYKTLVMRIAPLLRARVVESSGAIRGADRVAEGSDTLHLHANHRLTAV